MLLSFPRIRGDVPSENHSSATKNTVFPAYAGMFLLDGEMVDARVSFPRIRGDVPQIGSDVRNHNLFSPHTRGCSFEKEWHLGLVFVFPAYAGMFRRVPIIHQLANGFPRIRGDVPRRC